MRVWYGRSRACLVALMAWGAGACADAPTAPAVDPGAVAAARGPVDVELNPQPEPPAPLVVGFTVSPDGDSWYGEIFVGDQSCGSLELPAVQSRATGVVSHLAFTLQLTGANPDFHLVADVAGIANGRNGLLSLNGVVTDGVMQGAHVHLGGRGEPSGLGGVSGYVELNPQPEPPSAAGHTYPPSPCQG